MIFAAAVLFSLFSSLLCFPAAGPDSLEGLPGQIIQKFRDHRKDDVIDLLEELQDTYEWANEQPEWAEFSFPVEQIIPVPMIGDVKLRVQALTFTQFDAARDTEAPSSPAIVARTEYGYRLGLFNIGVQLSGIEITTSGFFASTHTGTLNIELQDCFLDIELVEGQAIPRVTGKIGFSSYSFSSPSIMTELILAPVLMISESTMNETIEQAFAYYMTQFWLPVDMEFYIAVAADAFLVSEASTEGAKEEVVYDEEVDEEELANEEDDEEELPVQDIDVEQTEWEEDEEEAAQEEVAQKAGVRIRCLRD